MQTISERLQAEHPIRCTDRVVRGLLSGRIEVLRIPARFGVAPCAGPAEPEDITTVRRSSPFGKPGSLLWVQEAWTPLRAGSLSPVVRNISMPPRQVAYRADDLSPYDSHLGWIPPQRMPRWASRITLRVQSSCYELLHAVNHEKMPYEGFDYPTIVGRQLLYQSVWNEEHPARPHQWDTNPPTWVAWVTRERC